MIPAQLFSIPPRQLQTSEPFQSAISSFWCADNVREHLKNLRDAVDLAKALYAYDLRQKELEEIHLLKLSSQNGKDFPPDHSAEKNLPPSSNVSTLTSIQRVGNTSSDMPLRISEILEEKRISPSFQESLSLEAANSLILTLRNQLEPFDAITSQTSPWEQRSMAVRLAQKLQMAKRNKRWKRKKRRHVAELLRKEREDYEKADQDADDWRTREIAKDIARRKVESMKAIAAVKTKEERRRLESELELVLVVEKLQELRSIRIEKLKKQGHFFPQEDDKFLERVRAAVEEEERQTVAAADTDTAKDAIATAEVSRKPVTGTSMGTNDANLKKDEATVNQEQSSRMETERSSSMDVNLESEVKNYVGQASVAGYDSVSNLPFEFFHYYHGSSKDMGTLVEVRRMWDAYIRTGGSRIPGHWVQPPPTADEVWASYLVAPK